MFQFGWDVKNIVQKNFIISVAQPGKSVSIAIVVNRFCDSVFARIQLLNLCTISLSQVCLSSEFYADWSKISRAHNKILNLLFVKYYNNKENGQNVNAVMMKNMQDIERKEDSRSWILVLS